MLAWPLLTVDVDVHGAKPTADLCCVTVYASYCTAGFSPVICRLKQDAALSMSSERCAGGHCEMLLSASRQTTLLLPARLLDRSP